MLTDVLALPSLRPEVNLGVNKEQDAMAWVFARSYNVRHVLYQPRSWYNGYEWTEDASALVQQGDLLIHFPGYSKAKTMAMSRWLKELESPDGALFQIEAEYTIYPRLTREFWARLLKAQELIRKVDKNNATAIEVVGNELIGTKLLKKSEWKMPLLRSTRLWRLGKAIRIDQSMYSVS